MGIPRSSRHRVWLVIASIALVLSFFVPLALGRPAHRDWSFAWDRWDASHAPSFIAVSLLLPLLGLILLALTPLLSRGRCRNAPLFLALTAALITLAQAGPAASLSFRFEETTFDSDRPVCLFLLLGGAIAMAGISLRRPTPPNPLGRRLLALGSVWIVLGLSAFADAQPPLFVPLIEDIWEKAWPLLAVLTGVAALGILGLLDALVSSRGGILDRVVWWLAAILALVMPVAFVGTLGIVLTDPDYVFLISVTVVTVLSWYGLMTAVAVGLAMALSTPAPPPLPALLPTPPPLPPLPPDHQA